MKLTHNGQVQQFTRYEFQDRYEASSAEQRDALAVAVREGVFTTDDGEVITGTALHRLRTRLLATDERHVQPLPGRRHRTEGSRRFLIPDLWPWGTVPALSGNKKAGKSTVVTDLTRALLVPGYRFLGHFDSAEMTEDERNLGVVLINAENPPEDYEAALARGMTDEAWQMLTVEHLEDEGGAHFMDLTDPDTYDLWVSRLADCHECDGSDDWVPTTVIVDGVTAILQDAGREVDDFGKWYMAFRRLLRECDIPNGLAVGHSTMAGGHLMGGTASGAGPDGLWTYSADNVDRPNSPRRFAVQPRMGGVPLPPTRVVEDEGRPVIRSKPGTDQVEDEPEDEAEDLRAVIAHRMADYVRENPGAHGQQLTENVDYGGWKQNALAGRTKALDLGLIRAEQCKPGCTLCTSSHHKRQHYWPVTTAP